MKLVFCGNCQMGALQRAYQTLVSPHTGDETTFVTFQHVDRPASRHAAAKADILVEQIWPTHKDGWLKGVNPGARRLRVPSVGAPFLFPFAGTSHPDGARTYGAYYPFDGDYGDAWLVRRLKAGADPGRIQAEYFELDIARAGHLDRRLEMSLDGQRALDRGTGYDFATIIETHFRTERLFKTPFHAEGRIMRHMLAVLLAKLDAPDAATRLLEPYLRSGFFQPRDMPLHPGVAAHFNLTWASQVVQYRFLSETFLTFPEWVGRFLRCEANPAVSRGVEAVLHNQPGAEDLLKQAATLLPASPLVAYAQGIMALRAGRYHEALHVLDGIAARFPNLAQIHAYRAQCHAALGDPDSEELALRQEIARSQHVRGLYVRLSILLAAQGRQADATTARQHAEALAPPKQRQ